MTAEAGLISELVTLLVHMGICSPWPPSADGGAQWLVPLRLPAERAELPQEWMQVAGDAADSSAAASFVGRLLDFGAARIPSGCTGQVLAHCTAMAGLSGQTVNWNTGLHALLRSTGHSSFPFMLTIEQSGPQTIALRARVASSADAHAVLLQSVAMFEVRTFSAFVFSALVLSACQLVSFSPCVVCMRILRAQEQMLSLITSKWPGCSPVAFTLLPGPMSQPPVLGPALSVATHKANLGETEHVTKNGVRVNLCELVAARPIELSTETQRQLVTLRFFSMLSQMTRGLQMIPAVQAFAATLEEAGDHALGGRYHDHGHRWSSRLETHGAAASSSDQIGTLVPSVVESSAVQSGQPRIAALVSFLGEVYEQSMDIVSSRQFSLESLCKHVLREFDWLAPAVLRAAEAHQLP
eukprot:COSAG06_NODE_6159_length_3076_cov_9.513432_4_plen_410_part_01